jgi:hypothetical protein
MLDSSPPPSETLLTILPNEIDGMPNGVALVLDDYLENLQQTAGSEAHPGCGPRP